MADQLTIAQGTPARQLFALKAKIMFMLSQPYFWDEEAAHAKLEEIVWPNGPVCIHCAATDRIGAVTGKGARAGLKFCCRCRKQFRATIGTIFEGSHVPLYKWFQACFLLVAAESSITAYRLHLHLEVTNKTAMGMFGRLGGQIMSARKSWRGNGRDWASSVQIGSSSEPMTPDSRFLHRTTGLSAKQSSCRIARGPSAIGWDELPWMPFPARPRRQFLRFVETARELGCVEDGESFDRVLAEMVAQPVRFTRGSRPAESKPGFAEPGRGILAPAAA
jgi:Transposase zinc-ribbon domain